MTVPDKSTVLAAIVLVQSGWWLAQWAPPTAHAEDEAPPASGLRLLCRTFPLDASPEATLETADSSVPLGAWIAEKSRDWTLYTLDYEIGQKSTGFPQHWVQACLMPR